MKKLLWLVLFFPVFALAQVHALNDTVLIAGTSPFTPQYRYVTTQYGRLTYEYNPVTGKYDLVVTGKYLRANYAPLSAGGYFQIANNLSESTSFPMLRTNIGLGSGSDVTFRTLSFTLMQHLATPPAYYLTLDGSGMIRQRFNAEVRSDIGAVAITDTSLFLRKVNYVPTADIFNGLDTFKYVNDVGLKGSPYLDQYGSKTSATASGTNTYAATLSPPIFAYSTGAFYVIKFTNANTGASTLNINGIGAVSLVKGVSTALVAGDISAAAVLAVSYDFTSNTFRIVGGGLTSGVAGGDLSGTYPNPTVLNSAVIGKVLTGYTSGAGTVSATDNILQAFQKINGNVNVNTTNIATNTANIATNTSNIATNTTNIALRELLSNKVTTLDNSATHYPSTSAVTTVTNQKLLNQIYEQSYTTFQPPQDASWYLGDSMFAGTGSTIPVPLYLDNTFNTLGSNLAISGVGVRKEYQQFAINLPAVSVTPVITMVGFNNVRTATSDTVRINAVNAGHRAISGIQFAKRYFFPQDNTGYYTFSSGYAGAASETVLLDYGSRAYWFRHNTATSTTANNFYKASLTVNETATLVMPIACTGFVIGTWGSDGTLVNQSRIQIKVDGVVVQTYTPNGRYYTGFSEGFTQDGIVNDAIFITGLSNTAHTVVLTFLDGSKPGGFDYIATLKSSAEAEVTPFYVNDIPHLSNGASVGYNYPGFITTQAVLDTVTARRRVYLAANVPFPIAFVDINTLYDPSVSANVNADGIHPTNAGNALIAQRMIYYMNSGYYLRKAINPVVYNPTTGSLSIGNGSFSNSPASALFNTSAGLQALANTAITGADNVSLGHLNLQLNTTGSGNISAGSNALKVNTTGGYNVVLGNQGFVGNTLGIGNIGIGNRTGSGNTTGNYNTYIGYNNMDAAGYTIRSYNISIGAFCGVWDSTFGSQLNIGNVIYGMNMYSGTTQTASPTATGRVGILVTTPTAVLHLKGGTATASGAPLKFSSGVATQTTTEAGAINFDGTNLYLGIASGNNHTFATDKNTLAFTNKDLTSGTNTFPTFNQNTTGSAATLTTPRNIQGVAFDGSAAINPINGTGFVKATGTTLSYDNSTYLTTASAASTYAPISTSTNYIQNQTSSAQSASFWISGTAQVNGLVTGNNGFYAPTGYGITADYGAFAENSTGNVLSGQNTSATGDGVYAGGGSTKGSTHSALNVQNYTGAQIAKFYSDEIDFSVPLVGTSLVKSGATTTNLLLAGGGDIAQSTFALAASASADLTAQTTAGNITTYTTTATGTYNISAYLNVTAVVTDVIQIQVTYTDENSNAQTVSFSTLNSISDSSYNPVIIRAKTGTTITVKTNLTTGIGTITFDAGARIIQI